MASGLSFSSIRPHAASVCRTCGKEVHSSVHVGDMQKSEHGFGGQRDAQSMREGAGAGLGKISRMDDGTDIPHGMSPLLRIVPADRYHRTLLASNLHHDPRVSIRSRHIGTRPRWRGWDGGNHGRCGRPAAGDDRPPGSRRCARLACWRSRWPSGFRPLAQARPPTSRRRRRRLCRPRAPAAREDEVTGNCTPPIAIPRNHETIETLPDGRSSAAPRPVVPSRAPRSVVGRARDGVKFRGSGSAQAAL